LPPVAESPKSSPENPDEAKKHTRIRTARAMRHKASMTTLIAALGATYLVAMEVKDMLVGRTETQGMQGFEWSREESR
jgi:hypothetical protein